MQDDLLKNVSSLVVNFTAQRNKSLRDAGQSVRKAMKDGMESMEVFSTEHGRRMDDFAREVQSMASQVQEKGSSGRDAADEMEKALESVNFCR